MYKKTDSRGFTQSLKFALGGLYSVRIGIRELSENIRNSFRLSPRPAGARANSSAGFTLIELLVVIAIIGLLSSVVLASLNGARKKGRDSRRIADLKQMQTALELYYDNNRAYPAALASLVTDGSMPAIPSDPGTYSYVYVENATTNNYYCIGATLESTVPTPADTCDAAQLGTTEPGGTVNYRVGP